jgi:beta-lactamase class A
VASEGILRFMQPRTQLTLRDLGLLVMALSDNEAANELIRRVGMENVNRRLDELSLTSTRLRRLMLDLEAARAGRENVSTPRQLAALARLVAAGEGLPPALAADLLTVASVPDPGSFFRLGIPEGPRAVTKLGTLEGVRCEAAWVDLPGRPYAAAVMTSYLKRDKDGEAAIAEISAAIYETFDRLARSTPYGRVVSPR